MALIWLVEDEAAIADTLQYKLQCENFQVVWFEKGEPVLELLSSPTSIKPDLIILDVGLPDINGFELAKKIFQHPNAPKNGYPIIFLTARSEEFDRVLGLEIGADDYIAKPFSLREVIARIKTVLRRVEKQQEIFKNISDFLVVGPFKVVDDGHVIHYFNVPLLLTRYEYLLLKTLLSAPNRIYGRAQLMDLVWKDSEDSFERTVDTHIKTLRNKLNQINDQLQPIQTHRGLGYSLTLF